MQLSQRGGCSQRTGSCKCAVVRRCHRARRPGGAASKRLQGRRECRRGVERRGQGMALYRRSAHQRRQALRRGSAAGAAARARLLCWRRRGWRIMLL